MRTAAAAALFAMVFGPAGVVSADPHNVLVLKAEGNADAAARGRVEQAVLRLAKTNVEGNVVLGEITFTDAAAATGCKPEAASCRDEVMTTLSVDEIVIPTATTANGAIHITVRRAAKGQQVKDSLATVAASDPSDAGIDAAIGPLFGVTKPAAPTAPPPHDAIAVQNPSTGTDNTAPPVATGSAAAPAERPPATPPVSAAPNNVVSTPAPGPSDQGGGHTGIILTGFIGGGAALAIGIGMWAAASQTDSQIQSQPTTSTADLNKLRNLESQGDAQAAFGNVFFVGGVVLAAVGGLYLWKDHHHHDSTQARLAPMAGPHTAGITLTIGGQP